MSNNIEKDELSKVSQDELNIFKENYDTEKILKEVEERVRTVPDKFTDKSISIYQMNDQIVVLSYKSDIKSWILSFLDKNSLNLNEEYLIFN